MSRLIIEYDYYWHLWLLVAGLREEEKLMKLESRNFFLCPKLNDAGNTPCSIGARETTKKSLFPLTKLMDFLL